jgi:hypothetical protein
MNQNPYAPPGASVADIDVDTSLERPRQVRTAIRVLWLAVSLGLALGVYRVFVVPSPLSMAFRAGTLIVGWGIGLAFIYWILSSIGNGKNWARILMLSFVVLRLALAWWTLPIVFALSRVLGVLTVAQFALSASGVALLFMQPANSWYRAMRGRSRA